MGDLLAALREPPGEAKRPGGQVTGECGSRRVWQLDVDTRASVKGLVKGRPGLNRSDSVRGRRGVCYGGDSLGGNEKQDRGCGAAGR